SPLRKPRKDRPGPGGSTAVAGQLDEVAGQLAGRPATVEGWGRIGGRSDRIQIRLRGAGAGEGRWVVRALPVGQEPEVGRRVRSEVAVPAFVGDGVRVGAERGLAAPDLVEGL